MDTGSPLLLLLPSSLLLPLGPDELLLAGPVEPESEPDESTMPSLLAMGPVLGSGVGSVTEVVELSAEPVLLVTGNEAVVDPLLPLLRLGA